MGVFFIIFLITNFCKFKKYYNFFFAYNKLLNLDFLNWFELVLNIFA